jgi:rfaE bifunctional protein kinase chain/domain
MLERFSKVSDLTIVVIGDIILDEYIEGTITRMSAEAPIPIVDKTETSYVLGGSANVAANILSLGANPILLGTIGHDPQGVIIKDQLEHASITSEYIIKTNKPTTVKSRIIVGEKQIFRIDSEDTSLISDTVSTQLIDQLLSIISLQKIDGIIFQDYNKGIFTRTLIESLINIARENDIATFVDPKFGNYWEYSGVDYFKPNKKELYTALVNSDIDLPEALKKTRIKLKCKKVICTLAQDGISSSSADEYLYQPTQKIEVVDVSGAGDTTMAMISIATLLEYSASEILQLSNAAGRAACLKKGVAIVSLSDLIL